MAIGGLWVAFGRSTLPRVKKHSRDCYPFQWQGSVSLKGLNKPLGPGGLTKNNTRQPMNRSSISKFPPWRRMAVSNLTQPTRFPIRRKQFRCQVHQRTFRGSCVQFWVRRAGFYRSRRPSMHARAPKYQGCACGGSRPRWFVSRTGYPRRNDHTAPAQALPD